jgi:2-oxoglutarate dehydrogenase E1 component
MADFRELHGPNAGYVLGLYDQYLNDPTSVDPEWRSAFETFDPAALEGVAALAAAPAGAAPAAMGGA